jgi:hypothetical protein
MPTTQVDQTRARYRALKRHRGDDHPGTRAALAAFHEALAADKAVKLAEREALLREQIRQAVKTEPRLTELQRARLAALLLVPKRHPKAARERVA